MAGGIRGFKRGIAVGSEGTEGGVGRGAGEGEGDRLGMDWGLNMLGRKLRGRMGMINDTGIFRRESDGKGQESLIMKEDAGYCVN